MSDDAELFRHLYPDLRRYAAVVSAGGEDPDDLVQEAVARTLRRHRLSDLDDPAAYLRRTIVRQASNHRRRLARGMAAVARSGPRGEQPDERWSDLEDLRRLAPLDRAILYLSAVEGRSYAEIGGQLELSEAAARQRARRARETLRAHLRAEEAHDA